MKQFYISWIDTNDEVELVSDLQDLHHVGFNKLSIEREDTDDSEDELVKNDKDTRLIGFDKYSPYDHDVLDEDKNILSGIEVEPLGLVYHFEFHDTQNNVNKEFKMTSWKEIMKYLIEQLKIKEEYHPKPEYPDESSKDYP